MNTLRYIIPIFSIIFSFQTAFAAPAAYPGARGKPFEALQTQIDTIEAAVDAQIAELQAQLDTLEAQVLANSDDIAALQQWQETQDQMIYVLRTAVDRLQDQVLTNTADIAVLEEWRLRHSQMLLLLNARVNSLQLQVSANDRDIAALIAYDIALQQLITALQGQVSVLQQQINNNAGDITTLQNDISTINTQISSLQTALASKQNLITGYCGTGYSIRRIYSNGSVTCEYDNVAAGVGTFTTTGNSNYVNMPSKTYRSLYVSCPSMYRATGGGFSKESNLIEIYSNRAASSTSWYVYAYNNSIYSRYLYAFVTCARVY